MVTQIIKFAPSPSSSRSHLYLVVLITLIVFNSFGLGQHPAQAVKDVNGKKDSSDSQGHEHKDMHQKYHQTSHQPGHKGDGESVVEETRQQRLHENMKGQQEDALHYSQQKPNIHHDSLHTQQQKQHPHSNEHHQQGREEQNKDQKFGQMEQKGEQPPHQRVHHFKHEEQEHLQHEEQKYTEDFERAEKPYHRKDGSDAAEKPVTPQEGDGDNLWDAKNDFDDRDAAVLEYALRVKEQNAQKELQQQQLILQQTQGQKDVQDKEQQQQGDFYQTSTHQEKQEPKYKLVMYDEEDEDDWHKNTHHSEKKEENEEFKEPKKELTPEEIEAEALYQAGEKLINATYYKEYKEAYLYFLKAAELNHEKAKEYVAFGMLFGDYIPQNVTRASEIFKELAELGSSRAQLGLAFMYSAGFHFNSSQAKALVFLTFGALGGDAFAQMALGYRYYAGIGVESKCETALTYYRKVATKVADAVTFAGGPVVQRIRLQEEAESQGNNSPLLDDDLLQYYHFLADKGDQQAQIVLGTLYYQGGKGVQINHEQAHHYFSTASESGNAHALGYLGKMHSEGSPFVKQNNHTALEYFKMSAEKNNHIGQAGLGMMYLKGQGIDKDTSKAFRYFSLASDQGSVDGQLQLGIMYFTGNGIRKDYKMAVKYFTLASQNGHVLAYFNLAQMHATGIGVLRNCHTAVELFKNVAERGRWSEMLMDAHRMYQGGNVDTALIKYMFLAELGYEVAQSNVAYVLDNGIINKFEKYETYQRALLQYSRAAVQGSTYARLKIGDYYYYGCGTEVDYESAASHYRIASEQQRNAQAMFNLGYMHERGLGMKQDVHLAKRFYDMAAETSIDAHIPVTLALFKLGLFYGVDVFSKEFEGLSAVLEAMDPQILLGTMWDIYLASFLALGFTVLYFMRRMR